MKNEVITRERVEKELLGILARHVGPGTPIRRASTMLGDLALDSLAVMEIMADVEDQFGVLIPDDALAELSTVGDVLQALEALLQGKGVLES